MSRNFQGAILQRKAKKAQDLQLKLIQERVLKALPANLKKENEDLQKQVDEYCEELYNAGTYSPRKLLRTAYYRFAPPQAEQPQAAATEE